MLCVYANYCIAHIIVCVVLSWIKVKSSCLVLHQCSSIVG